MSALPSHSSWLTHPILPTFDWEEAPGVVEHCGKQAVNISLGRRRARKPGSKTEPELYVCKWYKTAGVRNNSICGPKYIQREYEVLSSLRHENIVQYVDFCYEPTGPRLARLYTEYCRGGDLRRFEDLDSERLGTPRVAQIFYQIAQALLYLHHGIYKFSNTIGLVSKPGGPIREWATILHRDIKPSNSQ